MSTKKLNFFDIMGEPKNDYEIRLETLRIRMVSIAELMTIMSESVNKRWKIDKRKEAKYFKKLSEEEQKRVLIDSEKIKNMVFEDIDENLSSDAQKVMSGVAHRHVYGYMLSMNICEMSVVSLVAFFEHFLREMIELIFTSRTELLKSEQKNISNEELLKFKSITDLKKKIIQDKTRSILRDDIEEIAYYFKKTFKYDMKKNEKWGDLRECIYRRNTIMHNNGVPDDIYIKKTGYSGSIFRLNTDAEYLGNCLFAITECSDSLCKFISKKFPSNTL